MSRLALVTPEGVLLTNEKPPEVETLVEEPLWQIAAKEAEKASTPKKVTEQ